MLMMLLSMLISKELHKKDSEVSIKIDHIYRCDRKNIIMDNSRGRGVLIACINHLRCNQIFFDDCVEMEYGAIELNTNNSGKLLIAVFYRPPSAPTEWLHGFIKML